MIEQNNIILISASDLHRTLRDLSNEVRGRADVQGRPRVYFNDGADAYGMLLQENNLGFSVSGTLNNATSYQLNTTIFNRDEEIGSVVLKIAAAPAGATVEQFFHDLH